MLPTPCKGLGSANLRAILQIASIAALRSLGSPQGALAPQLLDEVSKSLPVEPPVTLALVEQDSSNLFVAVRERDETFACFTISD